MVLIAVVAVSLMKVTPNHFTWPVLVHVTWFHDILSVFSVIYRWSSLQCYARCRINGNRNKCCSLNAGKEC